MIEIEYVSNLDSMVRSSDSHLSIFTFFFFTPVPGLSRHSTDTTLLGESLSEDDDLCDYVKPVEPLKGLCFIYCNLLRIKGCVLSSSSGSHE